jgi:hypothetical protein
VKETITITSSRKQEDNLGSEEEVVEEVHLKRTPREVALWARHKDDTEAVG